MPDLHTTSFSFAIDPAYKWPARLFGVHEGTARVSVDGDQVEARFGPWVVRTPRSNVSDVEVSGPYSVPRTIGPAHISAADRGLTFATNGTRGVCMSFREPVRGIDPLGLLRHPGLTVTVADVDGLVAALRADDPGSEPATPEDRQQELEEHRVEVEEERQEQAAEDHLHTMTAAELRQLAAERGVTHRSAAKKAELIGLLEADLGDDLVEELAPER